MSISLLRTTDGPASTQALAGRLARLARPGDVLLLIGGLGAGKTTFAQGFAAALGVTGPVTSPTFTLLRQYEVTGGSGVRQLLHADVYRLESLAEIEDLGLGELVEDTAVALVEWGERARPLFGSGSLLVELSAEDAPSDPGDPATGSEGHDERRTVRITAVDDAWAGRLAELGAEGPAVVVEAAP